MTAQTVAAQTIDSVGEVIPSDFTISYTLAKEPSEGVASRHIFIFLDGTWNEERTLTGLGPPTNVLRMYQDLNHETDPPEPQSSASRVIARYYRGVGNRQDNTAANQYWFAFNGMDEERIRSAAFADLYRDYKSKNDRIYIIGFSRGAASARLLAQDICLKGLPLQLEVCTTYFANLLTGQIEPRISLVKRIGDESKTHKPKIAFLGCWDTVDAFVLPNRFPRNKLKDKVVRGLQSLIPRLFGKERFRGGENKIPQDVDKAVHCVAMDETRHEFLPTLMPHAPNVEEVWFPGVHADVGGGYDDNMLAHAPYQFMKSRLIAAVNDQGGNVDTPLFKSKVEEEVEEEVSDDYCFHFHGLNAGIKRMKDLLGLGRSIRRIRVLGAPNESVKPKIHSSLKSIKNSGSVFAADHNDKRTWTITYEPYNVRELKGNFEYADDKTELSPIRRTHSINYY